MTTAEDHNPIDIDQAKQLETPEHEGSIKELQAENARLNLQTFHTVTQKQKANALQRQPALAAYPLQSYKDLVARAIAEIIGENYTAENFIFRPVPKKIDADFAISIEPTDKRNNEERQRSRQIFLANLDRIIAELPGKLPFPIEIEKQGIYLNIKFNRDKLVYDTLSSIETLGPDFGNSDSMHAHSFVIDFSSPNTAKTMHIGHLRSTIIGQVMINLLNSQGAITYGVNHLGDWGTQFGQLVTGYRLWGDEIRQQVDPEKNPVGYLAAIYARVKNAIEEEKKAGKETPLADDGRENFKKLEAGDPEIFKLWKLFKEMSLIDFDRIYKRLNIHFDLTLGESFYEDKMEAPIADLISMGLAKPDPKEPADSKALLVNLDEGNPERLDRKGEKVKDNVFLLRKSDGSSLYHTRDIAAIRYRKNTFAQKDKPFHILYVVGSEQTNHLKQCFETSVRLGDISEGTCEHLVFGMIKQDGKKIASRKGAGGLEDLLDQLSDTARELLTSRPQEQQAALPEEEIASNAEKIGVGSLIYTNLMQAREHDIKYNPEAMLDMTQQSGAYIQYTCVRLNSLYERISSHVSPLQPEMVKLLSEPFKDLLKLAAQFPEVVELAASQRAPHHLAEYLFKLSASFNLAYNQGGKIVDLDDASKAAYSHVLQSINIVLKKGLSLLNIAVPDRM